MKQIRIVGVPEHFNLPWHMAMDDGAFADCGIELQWTDVPEGTGRMAQMLQDDETDLAVILTEGVVKSISLGNPSKIIQVYVASPLQWGIHVGQQSRLGQLHELQQAKVAISRQGSGSHLMAVVHAEAQGWDFDRLQFEIIHTLEGAVEHLKNHGDCYFMWEHFTTKPLVDEGVFRRLGDCPTPWPCFVIAASERFLEKSPQLVPHLRRTINTYTSEFKRIPSIDRTIANRYHQRLEDVGRWLLKTEWGQDQLSEAKLNEVQQKLHKLGLVSSVHPASQFLH